MRQLVYVIRDQVAETNTPLFVCNNDAAAVRQYKQFVSELPPTMSPDDFLLFAVASWDSQNMIIASDADNVTDKNRVYPALINTHVSHETETETAVNYVP